MIKNGIIERTSLFIENELVGLIQVRYNEYQSQVFRVSPDDIKDILETVDIMSWEELPGTAIRVKATDEVINEVGNFLEERWWKHDTGTIDAEDK